jgi:hypothetical protein
MGSRLKMSSRRLMSWSMRTNSPTLPPDGTSRVRPQNTGISATLTSGPATMLQSSAPGRCGGWTKAIPPKGQRRMWLATPPT